MRGIIAATSFRGGRHEYPTRSHRGDDARRAVAQIGHARCGQRSPLQHGHGVAVADPALGQCRDEPAAAASSSLLVHTPPRSGSAGRRGRADRLKRSIDRRPRHRIALPPWPADVAGRARGLHPRAPSHRRRAASGRAPAPLAWDRRPAMLRASSSFDQSSGAEQPHRRHPELPDLAFRGPGAFPTATYASSLPSRMPPLPVPRHSQLREISRAAAAVRARTARVPRAHARYAHLP